MRMAILADAAAVVLLGIAGIMVGTASAFFYIILELPLRVYDALGALDARTPRHCGAALTIGMTASTLASGAGLVLGGTKAMYVLALGLGGIFTGLIAAGLSEVLSVLPHTMFTFHLEDDARPLMIAVCIGKTAGALLAMYLGI